MDKKSEIIQAITAWLADAAGVQFFCPGKGFLVDDHFDPEMDLLVRDEKLGSLGMIKVLTDVELKNHLEECLSHANYMRYLILEAERPHQVSEDPGNSCYQVELVLVITKDQGDVIANQLRGIAKTADYLYHLGLNLLCWPADESQVEERVMAAFPWLLRQTRQWMDLYSCDETTQYDQLEMSNYRLPGERIISFKDPVQIYFGHNGSGKSSIAEAFELMFTGKANRLRGLSSERLEEVVRYRGSKDKPELVLSNEEQKICYDFELGSSPLSANKPKRSSNSFLLNQDLMNLITCGDDALRSKTFLEAWFPDDRILLQSYMQASGAKKESLKELSEVMPNDQSEELLESHEWLQQSPLPEDRLSQFLPLSLLERNLLYEVQFPKHCFNSPKAFESYLLKLEKGFEAELKFKIDYGEALDLLKSYQHWFVSAQVSMDSDKVVLNDWLNRRARSSMAKEHFRLAETHRLARERGWLPPLAVAFDPDLTESLKAEWDSLAAEELEKERVAKDRFEGPQEAARDAGPVAPKKLAPNSSERALLDRVGEHLSVGKLGSALSTAFTSGEGTGDLSFAKGWADDLIRKLEARIDALVQYEECKPLKRWQCYQSHVSAYRKLAERAKELNRTFLGKLHEGVLPLSGVLNELMALFTPARWAYDPLKLSREQGVELKMADDAGLRLNTAELNVFVVALFLLMSPRRENLLILDDPLQNMDELTVTTLARGFARLVRTLPKKLRLLLFFHGVDDLERFSREIPATVYRLPWMGLAGEQGNSDVPIDAKPGLAWPLNSIDSLIPIEKWQKNDA